MTVYVDNFRMPARVLHISGRWSHLTADTETELHEFAARIGLQRAWFQIRCKTVRCDPCPHWHYDVTDSKRNEAIELGAKAIDIRDMGELTRKRRAALRAEQEALTAHTADGRLRRPEPPREDTPDE